MSFKSVHFKLTGLFILFVLGILAISWGCTYLRDVEDRHFGALAIALGYEAISTPIKTIFKMWSRSFSDYIEKG